MGTDVHVYVPPRVDVEDIIKVISLALDARGDWQHTVFPDYLRFAFEGTGITPDFHFGASEHHRTAEGKWTLRRRGWNLVSMSSSPTRVALAVKLVNAVGGYADFNDCDESDKDYERRTPRCFSSEDDDSFDAKLRRLKAVTKITSADIEATRSKASWPSDLEEARLS